MTTTISKAHPLAEGEGGDTYFQWHDLTQGKTLVQRDRFVHTGQRPDGVFFVHLCDDEAGEQVAEWGNGPTMDEAWRYAIGAYCGPIDAEYDESRLVAALQITAHAVKED